MKLLEKTLDKVLIFQSIGFRQLWKGVFGEAQAKWEVNGVEED